MNGGGLHTTAAQPAQKPGGWLALLVVFQGVLNDAN